MKVYLVTSANMGVVNDSKRLELFEDILAPCGVYSTLEQAKVACQEEVDETWKDDQEYANEETKDKNPPQLEWENKPDTEWGAISEELETTFRIYEREIEGS